MHRDVFYVIVLCVDQSIVPCFSGCYIHMSDKHVPRVGYLQSALARVTSCCWTASLVMTDKNKGHLHLPFCKLTDAECCGGSSSVARH